jgi:predicted metalloprotease
MKKIIILLLLFSQNLYSQDSYLLRTVMGIQNFWIQKFQQKQLTFNPPTVNTYSLQNPLNSTCGVQKNRILFTAS